MSHETQESPQIELRFSDIPKRDEQDRQLPALRVQMVRFIIDLEQLLLDHAEALTEALGKGSMDKFEVDKACALILWQLQEFDSRSIVERDREYESWLQHWQVDQDHACSWWDVDILVTSEKLCINDKDGNRVFTERS